MPYSEYLVELAPGWLSEPGSLKRRWLEAEGELLDLEIARAKEAVKARFPGICPSDALPVLGDEIQIDRGPGESEDSYRARLLAAFDTWRWAGTAYGMLLAFWYAGYRPSSGKVVLQTQGDPVSGGHEYELRSDFDPAVHAPEDALIVTPLGPVHLGGAPELWSDFACLFVAPAPSSWMPTPPADNSPEVEHIRRLITRWKPAHARCVRLRATIIDLWDYPSETWDPTSEPWDETGSNADWTPPS